MASLCTICFITICVNDIPDLVRTASLKMEKWKMVRSNTNQIRLFGIPKTPQSNTIQIRAIGTTDCVYSIRVRLNNAEQVCIPIVLVGCVECRSVIFM